MNYIDILRSIRDEIRNVNKNLEKIIRLLMERNQETIYMNRQVLLGGFLSHKSSCDTQA